MRILRPVRIGRITPRTSNPTVRRADHLAVKTAAPPPSKESDMTTLLSPEIVTTAELLERCDRCGAAAKLEAELVSGGGLAFCGHHANRYDADILRLAGRITLEEGFAWAGK